MLKRLFDFFASLCGLLVLAPALLFIAVLIAVDSPGPVFFRQVRVGRYGREFRIHKFRTMKVASEAAGQLTVGADSRITKVGGFLRKYKLDELPQLIDVLSGTMSLVGPRPEVPKYVSAYPCDVKELVLSVKPGITDKASIEMIDENDLLAGASDPEAYYIEHILPVKLAFYADYARHHTLIGDIGIIMQTIAKILGR